MLVLLTESANDKGLCGSSDNLFGVQQDETGDGGGIENTGKQIDDENLRSDAVDTAAGIELLTILNAHELSADESQAAAVVGVVDDGMLSESLADPAIFEFVGSDEDDEVAASGIVRVEEVYDDTEQAEAAGDDDQLIFLAQLAEDVLLEFLGLVKSWPAGE